MKRSDVIFMSSHYYLAGLQCVIEVEV